jgi:hypothetical protein
MIASKKLKYIGINLMKEWKELKYKNNKSLKKELQEDIKGWKHIPCSWTGRINIVKMATLPKVIYTFKIPDTFFTEEENNQF